MTPSDLAFILKQIKIAEHHAASITPTSGPCAGLVGNGPNQIPSPLVSLGLRTVDGSCNNLIAGQEFYGATHQVFPRLTTPVFKAAENSPPAFGPSHPTSYAQTKGLVFDSQPRVISNLIVDQTATNPAAIAAAGFPFRTQGNEGVFPCMDESVDPPLPLGCVPSGETLFIPNVTTDVGLSPPFNSLFTIFGQFFDHGVDKRKDSSKSGTVFVPLKDDDPLVAGPDHEFGTADDLDPSLRFMVLGRSANQPGPDGILGDDPSTTTVDESADDIHEAKNIDTPFVDQSQTYTSDPSHQVFLREYVNNSSGKPVSSGKLISLPDGGQATWAQLKAQAATMLGLKLVDMDVFNIPMLAVDPYGNFLPGAHGYPQYVTASGLVEGDPSASGGTGVPVPANAKRIGIAFMDDIAHSAAPNTTVGPDDDSTAGNSLDTTVPAGSYDDELLDMHFMAGDGRVNENIALTSIHQIFHSEHDRLVGYMKNVLVNDTSAQGVAALAEWKLSAGADGWNGERLFQAARFVTEMEYQHLVFEEFARKIQPLINPFQPFAFTQADINPAVKAEFAHAVYRFGHSMLTETISRTNADGSNNDIPLLDGFLNPAAYHDGGSAGSLTSDEAAGSIFMGMSDQTGNEIDEFVTDTLRNNLLGLPLDLPTINMTRARAEGIPSLNELRRQIYETTNDSQLIPYTDWVDFGLNLKNARSLINFVAAYGMHPTILYANAGADGIVFDDPGTAGVDESADNAPATLASRREAARLIVDPEPTDTAPTDAAAFMNGIGSWENRETGLNNVDLWVGGLAERTNLFGGLLGSTFNYVFESQLTDLQNSDRLYYLARTPGMNLRTQLEGNSFAELVMRNTNAHSLKADAFATADCKFQMSSLHGTAADFATLGNQVADDPSSECDEHALLIRMANGTIRYRTTNTVDPPGINGQSVYNGTNLADRIWGGVDNDTFLGNEGNDVIEGNDGADVALGGEGNDTITDSAGDDVLKGGPGNDAMESGPGLDLILGGDGSDFTNGGANINETFGGEGNDFMILGQGEDAGFGDGGDDWGEGGDQPDLLIGDSSSLFFTDQNKPGHDVLIGQAGDDDYDAEGGDDILVTGPGVEKNAGAAGYDFSTGFMDPQPQDADLRLPILPADILVVGVRDRFNEVEALSGGPFDDKLHGDDFIPVQQGGVGFIGCDALDQAGLDRIAGLDALVPALNTPTNQVIANSSSMDCPLTGPFVWGDGNILLGGAGSDLLEGRGADDILDGDQYLNARLSVRDHNDASIEVGTTDLMEHKYLRDSTGALVGPTLQQAVMAGAVDPGDIRIVRELLSSPNAGDVDRALFSDVLANYDITANANGSITVNHARGTATDGIDTLWNIEQAAFADQTVDLGAPAAPGIGTATNNGNFTATVRWTAPAGNLFFPRTGYRVQPTDAAGNPVGSTLSAGVNATSLVVSGLTGGNTYRFKVAAVNAVGTGAYSALSNSVTITGDSVPPTLIAQSPTPGQVNVAVGANVIVTFSEDVQGVSGGILGVGANFQLRRVAPPNNNIQAAVVTYNAATRTATLNPVLNLVAGVYRVTLADPDGAGPLLPIRDLAGNPLASTTWTFRVGPGAPPAPLIGSAIRGAAGGLTTATIRWSAPAGARDAAITGYQVTALRMSSRAANAAVLRRIAAPVSPASARAKVMTLPAGIYRFTVVAINADGKSSAGARSNVVVPR